MVDVPPFPSFSMMCLPSCASQSLPPSTVVNSPEPLSSRIFFIRSDLLQRPADNVVGEDFGQRGLVFGLQQRVDRAAGCLLKASLVGANTVKGPAPSSVSTRPAAFTAATGVV